jgi:hypothetical protein
MLKSLKKLLTSTKCAELENEVVALKAKLGEKQEVINKTNAYWKRELSKVKPKKISVKNL